MNYSIEKSEGAIKRKAMMITFLVLAAFVGLTMVSSGESLGKVKDTVMSWFAADADSSEEVAEVSKKKTA